MPQDGKVPGVYVEEASPPPSVTGVDTGVAAFLGYSEKAGSPDESVPFGGQPFLVPSMLEFERAFGGPFQGSLAGGPFLHDALTLFYANGGGPAWIVSAGDYEMLEADTVTGALDPARLHAALDRIGGHVGPTLLAAPDALLMTRDDYHGFAAAMLNQASALRDRFVILDVHGDPADGVEVLVGAFQEALAPIPDARSFGAAYFPPLWVGFGADRRAVPPSGAVVGAIVANDLARGVWKAPASITVQGVSDVLASINAAQQEPMNAPANGVAVNAIRVFPGRGIMIWGARTLDSGSGGGDFRYVPVRRTAIYVEQSVKTALGSFVFRPNDSESWTLAAAMIENFLIGLWREGGLLGVKPEEAFWVSCGLGSTMTAQDIQEGRMIVTIGMALLRPAEFVVLNLIQAMADPD